MKYAIVFPGQGSQSLGMLSDLADNFSIVNDVFTQASDALGVDLWKITQENQETLNQTQNTQPIMLSAGYAIYKVLASEADLSPFCMAGHSLGEYTALVAAGALDFTDSVNLVRRRAELMQSAVPVGAGAMAAIIGLDDDKVVEICANANSGIVEAVNFNSPGQVVIAGDRDLVEQTCVAMKEQGAKRALVLPVSVPSHCSLMNSTTEEFTIVIDATSFNQVGNVLHNVDADFASNVDEIKSKLVAQLHKPVLWTAIVKAMSAMGVERIIESGPGKVLAGLTRRIDKSLKSNAVFDTASVAIILEEIA